MCNGRVLRGRYAAAVCVLVAWSLVAHAPSAIAATITIDSFELPDPGTIFFLKGPPGWPTDNPITPQFDDPGILGGQRDVLVEVKGRAVVGSAVGIIGREDVSGKTVLRVATGGDPGTYVEAQYDGMDLENNTSPLNLGEFLVPIDLTDNGANDRFRLVFNSLDGGDEPKLAVTIKVVGSAGTTTIRREIDENGKSIPADFFFGDFSDPDLTNFETAKSITFGFNDPDDPVFHVDFELDLIEVVPEPSTMVMLLGLGVALLVATVHRRRKR